MERIALHPMPVADPAIVRLDNAEQALHRALSWRVFAPRAVANAHIRNAIADLRAVRGETVALALAA